MAAVDVPTRAPQMAPGQKVTEALKAGMYVVKGPDFNYGSTSPIELFRVPANTLVHDVVLNVKTAWDATGTPTLTIGDSDDDDRFMAAAVSLLKTAGWKSCKTGTAVNSGGYIYTADGLITATKTEPTAASSSGTAEVYLIYSNYSNLL